MPSPKFKPVEFIAACTPWHGSAIAKQLGLRGSEWAMYRIERLRGMDRPVVHVAMCAQLSEADTFFMTSRRSVLRVVEDSSH